MYKIKLLLLLLLLKFIRCFRKYFPPSLVYQSYLHDLICCCVSEYLCHVFVRSDSLAAVLITDHEYPNRVAFTLLNKVGL